MLLLALLLLWCLWQEEEQADTAANPTGRPQLLQSEATLPPIQGVPPHTPSTLHTPMSLATVTLPEPDLPQDLGVAMQGQNT
jgi:hypothetical protein